MRNRLPLISTFSLRCGVALAALTGFMGAAPFHNSASAADAKSGGLEEVVVTAQRRAENLQAVPISVTAINATALAKSGISGTIQINQIAPSVQVTRSGPSTIFYIRGVGNGSGQIGEEGANAFYIDGVYIGDLAQANVEFNNVDRIEILKGPQGTLFGRNASGGLVNIITRDPGDHFTAKALVGFSNYDTRKGQLYIAAPLTNDLSVDFAVTARQQRKGWGINKFNGRDYELGWMYGVRTKILWRPGDATKVTLSADFKRLHDSFTSGFQVVNGTVAAVTLVNGVGAPGFTYEGDYNVNTPTPGFTTQRVWGAALTVEHRFDWATFTNLAGTRYIYTTSAFDADYTPVQFTYANIFSRARTFQEEARLSSNTTEPLSWQTGVFYYHSKAELLGQNIIGPGVGGAGRGFRITSTMTTDSIAGFGEATYAITPTTHLTGGIRYTHEKRGYNGFEVPVNQPAGSVFATIFNVPRVIDHVSFNKATFRVAVRQDLNDKVNVYASFNRGFKSGLYATSATPGTNPPLRPQTINAVEAGLKSELFDDTLRFNVAYFHYKINDYQIRTAAVGGGGTAFLLNAGIVKVDGAEVDMQWAPTQELRITANATYLNSRFGTGARSQGYFPRPAVCTPAGQPTPPLGMTTGPATGGNIVCFGNITGYRTPQSPKFASSLGVTYTIDVGHEGELITNLLYSYTGKFFFEPDNRLKQGAVSLLNGALEYRPTSNWGIEVYANNLTDRRYYITGTGSGTGDHGELGPPRTYGVNLKIDY